MCNCRSGNKFTVQNMISNVGSSLPYLKFAYCAYKDQFEKAFAQVGVRVDEQSLPILAKYADNGDDMKGVLKDANGNPIIFSVEKQLHLIDKTQVENNACSL